jgi:hypothetical protein
MMYLVRRRRHLGIAIDPKQLGKIQPLKADVHIMEAENQALGRTTISAWIFSSAPVKDHDFTPLGSNPDPMSEPASFRSWLAERHGVRLDRRNWTRDWGGLIELQLDVAAQIDAMIIHLVAKVLYQQRPLAA